MNRRGNGGFTIVELLIVIVVIAVLAAITVVAFNGVRARAQNASINSSAAGMLKAIALFKASGKTTLLANTVNKDRLCLGDPSEYPAISGLSAGRCRSDDSAPRTYVADPYFAQEVSTLSSAKGATVSVTGTDGSIYRGIWYDDDTNTQPAIYYALKGNNQPCGVTGAIATNTNGITQCRVNIDVTIDYCAPSDSSCD